MFAFIKGLLHFSHPNYVIIEAGGIGYKIFIAPNIFSKLSQVGQTAFLHTSHVVREQSEALYGFLTPQERDFFESLLNVSGIGPKLALSLIGHITLPDLKVAIQNEDIAILSRVPGIGKKTAERLIIELRDKVPDTLATITLSETSKIQDAISALTNLGYNHSIAKKAISKTLEGSSKDLDLASLITLSLKNI